MKKLVLPYLSDSNTEAFGKIIGRLGEPSLFLIRVMVVLIFLYHGVPKALDWPMAMSKFEAMGFPGFLGPLVGITEVLASIFLLLGYWSALANFVLAIVIAVAIVGVQVPGALEAGKLIPGLERDLMIFTATLVLMAFGPGFFSVQNSK